MTARIFPMPDAEAEQDKNQDAKSASSTKIKGKIDSGKAEARLYSAKDAKEIEMMLNRILKLCGQAQNPGMAYRNLETIHALADALSDKLNLKTPAEPKS